MRILMLLLISALAACAAQPEPKAGASADGTTSPLKIADVALANGAPRARLLVWYDRRSGAQRTVGAGWLHSQKKIEGKSIRPLDSCNRLPS